MDYYNQLFEGQFNTYARLVKTEDGRRILKQIGFSDEWIDKLLRRISQFDKQMPQRTK